MSVQCSLHLVVRRIVTGLDNLTVACHELVDIGIVAELERPLVDGIPFDGDAWFLRLKTPQVLVETHQAFINRWSTQASRATHSWFIEFDFQRDLPNSECGENIGGAFSTTCVEFSGATRAGVLQQTPSWLLHGTGTLGRLPGAPGPQETGYEPGL